MTRIARGAVVVLALVLAPLGARAEGPVPVAGPPHAGPTKRLSKRLKRTSAGKRSRAKMRTAREKPDAEVAQAGIHAISGNAQVTPFPSHAAAARKALAQNRRDQLDDAEKAARAEHQEDRWHTVLFSLREFDARSDAEACFWRVLAYYRLGEMVRARHTRELCTLGPKEEAVLDAEDAMCGSLQPASVMPEMVAAGERPPAPVANPASYVGAAPVRIDR